MTAFLLGSVAVTTEHNLEEVLEKIVEFMCHKGKESKRLGSDVPKVTALQRQMD